MKKQEYKKEQLQSRRDFFKKATKYSLPILGAILLSNIPVLSKTKETEIEKGCRYGCSVSCHGSCVGTCSRTCKGVCQENCKFSCKGDCHRTCKWSCSESCADSSY